MSSYADDIQFAGLVEAATAAADEHQRTLKRKRHNGSAYTPIAPELTAQDQDRSTLSNSAAVLFREPSEKSKKYSRPPLGKVFNSLELSPEMFLSLQNAAKAYMLDEEHPERREVVGYKRQAGNNDVAKLKLYNCVEEFLRHGNVGDKYFGHSTDLEAPNASPRTFFWPQDHQRIVKLLMPLLRKMVTNERQRIYAAETRSKDPDKSSRQKLDSGKPSPSEDDKQQQHSDIDPSLRATATLVNEIMTTDDTELTRSSLVLRVNLTTDNGQRRLAPEMMVHSDIAPTMETLFRELERNYEDFVDPSSVSAWLPQGLTEIRGDTEWVMACMTANATEWMDRQLKLLVELPQVIEST